VRQVGQLPRIFTGCTLACNGLWNTVVIVALPNMNFHYTNTRKFLYVVFQCLLFITKLYSYILITSSWQN